MIYHFLKWVAQTSILFLFLWMIAGRLSKKCIGSTFEEKRSWKSLCSPIANWQSSNTNKKKLSVVKSSTQSVHHTLDIVQTGCNPLSPLFWSPWHKFFKTVLNTVFTPTRATLQTNLGTFVDTLSAFSNLSGIDVIFVNGHMHYADWTGNVQSLDTLGTKNQVSISRWTKLRFAMIPLTVFLEPFSECMLSGALAALASYLLFRFVIF